MSLTTMTIGEQLNWSKEKHPETRHNTTCVFHLNKDCNCPRCKGLKKRIK